MRERPTRIRTVYADKVALTKAWGAATTALES